MSSPRNQSPPGIQLRRPSKYLTDPSKPTTNTGSPFVPPPNQWILGRWTVTYSTRSIWRPAKNVRITFSPHKKTPAPSSTSTSMPQAIGEEAAKFHSSLESGKQGDPNSMKTVQFTETPDPMVPGAWRGRGSGKGWRAITSRVTTTTTHWQVLGWGARPLARSEGEGGDEVAGEERWMVVWFQATPLADEGIDIYCDRDEGLSREAADDIIGALKGLHAPATVHAVETDMMRLVIDLPDKYMHS